MTEDQQIDLDDIQGQLDKIRASADKAEWPEVRERLAETRRHLDHLCVSSAYVLWLSAVAADMTENPEEAVAFVRQARTIDRFQTDFIRSEQVIFHHTRSLLNDRAASGDVGGLRIYELLLLHGEADSSSHLAAARCHLAADNVEAAGKLADALVLLSPGWSEAWRLKADVARRARNETLAVEMEARALTAARPAPAWPAQSGHRAEA